LQSTSNSIKEHTLDLLERALQLKTDIPAIFLSLKSSETPWYAKLLAGLTLIYALSPIDLIPDFIPVLGYLDDLIVLPALIALTIHFIPRDIFEHYRQEAQGMWQDGKPKKWYFAIPFVLVWLFILWLIVKRFLLHP
jgi:uncharacterized membrane protein YkvA (DUF1232 family)